MERGKRLPLIAGVAGVAALAVAEAACGGGSDGTSTTVGEPTFIDPTHTEQFDQTIVPTKTVVTVPTETAEPLDIIGEITKVNDQILTVLAGIPDSEDVIQVKLDLENGLSQVNRAESSPDLINSAVNNLGNAGKGLANLACLHTQSAEIANSWLALREYVGNYVLDKSDKGLWPGSSDSTLNFFFQVPPGCENPDMVLDDK